MNKKSKKGFSFIEVVIIVVIVALLATMAVPALNKVKQKAKINAISDNLKMIATAGSQYMLENNVTSVSYNSLVGTYFSPIKPVAGEDYANITVFETNINNELKTTMSNGTIVSFIY
ncbi:hypothetical protein AYO37_01235 [Opitutia bacterium SCGC AG-212-L18]|nr:hypothetical protein AYO37_01235 [Opitutae bacterium SCGC AG-212-L18]